MRIVTLFLIVILSVCSGFSQSQHSSYFFRNLSRNKGFKPTDIKAILQDSSGFMWFGTKNNLNRFDGQNIQIYDCFDSEIGFRNNNVSALHEDSLKNLWIGTDKGIFIFEPISEKVTYFTHKTPDGIAITDWIQSIVNDDQGNIWIVVPNQGVFRFCDNKLHLYTFSQQSPDKGSPESICIDKSGKVWVGTNGMGLYSYESLNDKFEATEVADPTNYLGGQSIYCMCDYGEFLVLGCHEGKLLKYNKRNQLLTEFFTSEVNHKIIRDLQNYNDEIWVATESGIYVINESKNTVAHIVNDPMCGFTLSDNQIAQIYRDRENGIWIGTNLGGVNYLPPSYTDFTRYVPLTSNSINSKQVRSIIEDSNNNIWIGTYDAGVCYLSNSTGQFHNVNSRLNSNKVLSLFANDNKVWIGYFKNGLDVTNNKTLSTQHYSANNLGINEASIYAICDDSNGNTWIGNGWGVYVGNKMTMKFEHMPQFGSAFIFDIIEDINKNIWVASMGKGVFKYNPLTQEIENFTHDEKNPKSLSSNSVSSIMETSDGNIWFSTDRGGICLYNKATNDFTSYGIKEGLPDETAYKILEDKDGFLWFGTNNGLVKFNPQDASCKVFTTYNGLPSNQFSYKSALKASDGRFYFGCAEGMIAFNPYSISKNQTPPSVFITKLLVNNLEITPKSDKSPLSQSIIYTDEITLNHHQNTIGFEFASLSYIMPTANIIAYKMEGVNDDWVHTTTGASMVYTNLTPGNYTLRVKGANNDGVWSDKEISLKINILAPWWNTTLAKIVYILLALVLITYTIRLLRIRGEKKTHEEKLLYESEKEKELYRTKLDFYTDVAHEIRTPVTLINGPLETLVDMDIADAEIKRNLATMQRNTNELLNITNQLLDFRKIDNNKMHLNISCVNITELLNQKVLEFDELKETNKNIGFNIPDNEIYVSADKNSIIKIINNLLSNAVKYSDSFVNVEMKCENGTVTISVLNDGDTVPEDAHDKIFEPFFQLRKNMNNPASSGIGLNLAKQLAEMNNGSLIYKVVNGLNVFEVTLKQECNVPVAKEPHPDTIFDNETALADDDKRNLVVMMVEDNSELLSFIAGKLSTIYTVETATNGVEALAKLSECNADIVISDIMMPEMDGLELCKHIKANIETSHIPVILLTAKNDLDSKVEGLKLGADAYIEKPFSFKYLVAQITSIIDNRIRDRESFSKKPFISTNSFGISKADQTLINKIIETIEENITNPNFGVELLAEKACMSRSSLHRKIKAVSGTSPTDFIRLIRLKKSTELITEGSYRIGEVCYLVGINSPSYFIKLFQKQYGITPKEFEKQQRQRREENEKEEF